MSKAPKRARKNDKSGSSQTVLSAASGPAQKYSPSVMEIRPEADKKTYTGKKSEKSLPEKTAIAYYVAAQLIRDQGSIFFDAGSTLRMIARATFVRANDTFLSLIVTTNNMDISEDFLSSGHTYSPDPLRCDVSLQLTGGKHDRNHHALFGELARFTLEKVYPETVIMGITGFTGEGLYYHGATEEQAIKQALYSKAVERRIVAFDHSKLGKRDMFLCTDTAGHAIEALCQNVEEKTIIVTSAPESKDEWTGWEQRFDKIHKDKQLASKIGDGALEIVAVSLAKDPPYYKEEKHFGS